MPGIWAIRSLHAAHLGHLLELLAEVVEREVALGQLGLLLLDLLLRQLGLDALDLFDDPHDVALAQDPLGHALGDELFQGLSSFSPTPTNLIGTLVTSLIDRAAPPRASPSSLVRITPLRSRASLNALAAVDGVLAGHGVADEETPRRA